MNSINKFWSKRYTDGQTGWDIGYVSTPIKEYVDQLEDNKITILIPGAGNSYEGQYLYDQGFHHTHLCDISTHPIENFKKRTPQFPEDQLHHQDFFTLTGKYDLIIEQTFFCAIPRDRRMDYIDQVSSLLKPGGKLVGLLFDMEFDREGPPHGGSEEEYRKNFSRKLDIKLMEPCYNSIEPRMGSELFFIAQKS